MKRIMRIGALGLLAMLVALAVTVVVLAVDGTGEGVYSWLLAGASNQGKTCAALQGTFADPGTTWLEFKIESGASGDYSDGYLEVNIVATGGNFFDWSSNVGVDAIVVKNGVDGASFYVYDGLTSPADETVYSGTNGSLRDPEEFSDTGLSTPYDGAKGISHISFCYDEEEVGTKSGYKWHDLNGDGIWQKGTDGLPNTGDAGEEPTIPGWTISVYDPMDLTTPLLTQPTDSDGFYRFNLMPGSYVVCEDLPADWYQSFPTTGPTCDNGTIGHSVEIVGGDNHTGNNFGNHQYITKSGYKWHDLNADGIWDDDEPGLPDWTIQAWKGGVMVADTTTGTDGYYEFSLPPGTYTFNEVCEPDWFQSWPEPTDGCGSGVYADVILTSGDEPHTGNNFGNWMYATKTGRKWHDLNADGEWNDPPEPPYEGLVVELWDVSDALPTFVMSDTTAADGRYLFDTVLPGVDYIVCEVKEDGWHQSFPTVDMLPLPAIADCTILGDGYGPVGYAVNLESGQVDWNNHFGNYQYITKSGYKWHDLNADGIWDDGEPGLPDWTIRAWKGGVMVADTTTGSDGYYEFSLPPGTYTFNEVCEPDWFQSWPEPTDGCGSGVYADVILTSGDEPHTGNNFGNWMYATKTGHKWHDLNADGVWQLGADGQPNTGDLGEEPTIEGWVVELWDVSDDIVGPTFVMSDTTGPNGRYLFDMVLPGVEHIVCEVMEDGWYQSFPTLDMLPLPAIADCTILGDGYGPVGYAVNLESGQVDWNNHFGNYQYITKSGYKWHDLNADGVWQLGDDGLPNTGDEGEEPTIEGWQICANGDCTYTDEYGYYEFSLPPGTYTFNEVCEPDWEQSWPEPTDGCGSGVYADVILTSGDEPHTGNNFGNWMYATKTGRKWHDLNKDGWIDHPDEPLLRMWTIELWDVSGDVPTLSMSDTTDAGGFYLFDRVVPGVHYIVCEVMEEHGWHQSFPTGDPPLPAIADCSILGDGYGPWGWAVNLKSGEVDCGNRFGNYRELGCTLTFGYWKTHGDPDNDKKYDDTWEEVGGPDAPFFDTGQSWMEVLWTAPSGGNAYYILAHQYIAAILNSLKDVHPAGTWMIAEELAQAQALLDYYDTYEGGPYIPADGTVFNGPDRALAIEIAETLDQFNNGELADGPPHCDE